MQVNKLKIYNKHYKNLEMDKYNYHIINQFKQSNN